MSRKVKTFCFLVKKSLKDLAGFPEVRTFASAFGQKSRWRDKKKRSLKGFHKDREVVQEAPAAMYFGVPGVENTSRQLR